MRHFFFNFRLDAIQRGTLPQVGGRRGPYAPYIPSAHVRNYEFQIPLNTEINAVRSMETRGTISTSCSDATSSSSGGVIDVLSDGGRAILSLM